MARTIAALLAPSSIVAVLALIGTILPAATQAAHVQWIRCPDGSGGTQGFDDLWPTSTTARLLPDQDSAGASGFEFNVRADYAGEATCAELLQGDPPDMTISFDALTLSETYVVPPLNWTCVPFWDRPAVEQQHLKNRQPEIRLVAQHNLGKLGLLPAFSVQVSFSASNKTGSAVGSSACVYSEITPELRQEVSTAARYGPIVVFLLVFLSGLLVTLFAPAVSAEHSPSAGGITGQGLQHHITNTSQSGILQRAILPGVGDCLLHLQFIFFLGALTLRYPGFYQPVTSLLHWSALFSPIGPFGQEWRYDGVVDGIYEINGTLTGSYGLELMSQITGGPVTTDVWWNMVAIAAIITAVVAVLLLFHRVLSQHVPSLDWLAIDKDLGGEGPTSGSAFARGIWSVLRVILSYFLTPIVAISAYQLDNILLPAYHLALATLLIVLVIVGLTWMWKSAPSNQLGVLLLDPSKRYRRVSTDDSGSDTESERPAKARDLFAAIFFLLAFIRGITVGGLQFSPLAQVIILAATELSLLVTTAVLRPMRWQILAVFAGSGVARLMVVALTAVFLPELNASMSTRSRVGIAILVIHVAVLVFACTVPAGVRISSLISNTRAPADEPEIYGLSQLRRRSYALNDLSVPPLRAPVPARPYASARTNSPTCHHGHSPSDASSVFYHDRTSSPDALYLRAVPQHHYFRQPRSSSSTSRSRSHGSSRIAQGPPSSPRTSGSQWSSSQGGSSPTAVRSSSILTPAKAQRSETSNSEGTMEDTSEPPLITPHHGADYAFREADLYYGHGRPRRTGTFGPAAAAAVTPTPQSQPSAVRRVVSGMRDQLMGRRSASVERRGGHKGFEVRRPPRPPGL